MTATYKQVELTPGKMVSEIDYFCCDGCGATIDAKERREKRAWAGIHHGFLEQSGGYKPLDTCSVECFRKVVLKFTEDNPDCKNVELTTMGTEFAKSLSEPKIVYSAYQPPQTY